MALVKQLLTHTDFSGINVSAGSIVKPNPTPGTWPGAVAAVGPGYDSSAATGLSLPMTNQYQYNVNYWSVIQCGQNKASLWLNGWGYHLPKDTPTSSLAGYHLAIGGGRNTPTMFQPWAVAGQYLQLNHIETLATSYHVGSALSQTYISMFLYCPPSGSLPGRSMNVTIATWASKAGVHGEGVFHDTNSDTVAGGLGAYASTLLKPNSRYLTNWGAESTSGTGVRGADRAIGFNITKQNMQNLLNDYCAVTGADLAYYGNPANWCFDGALYQVETLWPNADRPAAGGPLPGQCGVRFKNIEVNVFN